MVWKVMEKEEIVLFPRDSGRIPNFKGADKAASLLSKLPEWQKARSIKSNPDFPQRPVRYQTCQFISEKVGGGM